jgi:alkylation response protein AidB-like acyl-CoA dehydrogenase
VADGSNVAAVAAALIGTGVGAGTALGVEWVRARAASSASRRDALLAACSSFTAAVARTRSLCYDLEGPGAKQRVRAQLEEARAECERLRLLIDASDTPRAARMVLRHLWAVWHLAERGTDPRAEEFPGTTPWSRLRSELTALYIGVRREIGSRHPEDVFRELD